MRNLLFILCTLLLLAGCKQPPQQSSAVVELPEELKELPTGTTLDFGDTRLEIIKDGQAVLTQSQPVPVIKKCKGCFNTDNSDHSKDKSKEKPKTKEDNSRGKKAKVDNSQDNRVNPPPDNAQSFINKLQSIFTWALVIGAVVVIAAIVFKFV